MARLFRADAPCALCPRLCGVRRTADAGDGFCGMGTQPVAARALPHLWEEPCVSGQRGSGAVFFSGCTLRFDYCRNRDISHEGFGRRLTPPQLGGIMRRLVEEEGDHSISLISPAHFLPGIIEALYRYRPPVPQICLAAENSEHRRGICS